MTSIRPSRLTIKNFRSFLHETTFEFPERGLVLVRGWNEDAQDTSGSGKSSFLEALAFANDISEFPATEHQSWFTEEPFEVTYDFELDDGRGGRRKLGKTTTLSFDKSPLLKSARSIKDEMTRIMGLSPDMLKALAYRPQRKPGLFLTMTDSEKKEFLTSLLGLKQFEVEAEKAQRRITALAQETEKRDALLVMARGYVGHEPKFTPQDVDESGLLGLREKLRLGQSALPEFRRSVEDAREHVTAALREVDEQHQQAAAPIQKERDEYKAQPLPTGDFDAREKKLRVRLELVGARFSEAMAAWDKQWKYYEDTCRGLRDGVVKELRLAAPKEEYQRQLREVESDITTLRSAKCPMCEREWVTAQKKLAEKESESGDLEQHIAECVRHEGAAESLRQSLVSWEAEKEKFRQTPAVPQDILDAREALISSLGAVKAERVDFQSKNESERRAKLAEYEQRLSGIATVYRDQEEGMRERMGRLVVKLERSLALLEADVSALTEQVKAEERRLNDIREGNRRGLAQFETGHKVWEQAVENVKKAEEALAQAQSDLALEKDFVNTIGREGFLGLIFDDVLDSISNETNDILARVPNVAHITLQFASERETQDGKLRKEIKPLIRAGGREVTLRALSGGMQAAVELAVDIAVGTVVMQRTGVFPGWLVLDEAFDGLGVNAKKACLEILKRAAEDRLIIVVDHATEIREAFDTVFNITLRDGISVLS